MISPVEQVRDLHHDREMLRKRYANLEAELNKALSSPVTSRSVNAGSYEALKEAYEEERRQQEGLMEEVASLNKALAKEKEKVRA